MATARVARTLRVLVFIIVGVVLWQCRSMLRSGGIDELRACKDRIAELERQLTSGGVRVGEVADGTSSASMNGRRALDTPHAPPNQHERFVTGDGNVLKPIQVRLRGGAIEEVDVNFTLFSAASLERFEAMVPTSLLPKTRVFVVIVSSQSMRSAKQRTLIRETWMRQIQEELEPADIVARFFVGVSSTSGIPVSPGVMNEMQQNNDMVVVSVGDAYGGLIAKVQASLQWVVSSIRADVVAKFDDDCYVSPTALLRELTQLPRERLYWGRMMGGGPIQRNGGRNAEPNMPRGVDWFPPYASGGGGYALSWDLVHAVAFPLVKQLDMVNEDGHLGVMLLPYDIHRETTHRLHPYGLQREGDKCISADDIVAVHYVKDAGEHDCMLLPQYFLAIKPHDCDCVSSSITHTHTHTHTHTRMLDVCLNILLFSTTLSLSLWGLIFSKHSCFFYQ